MGQASINTLVCRSGEGVHYAHEKKVEDGSSLYPWIKRHKEDMDRRRGATSTKGNRNKDMCAFFELPRKNGENYG